MTAKTTTNSEEIYWGYPPFVRSLRRYLIRKYNRNWNWNCNRNWIQWSSRNTNRRTRSTATGNHPRRRKISYSRRRGRGSNLLREEGRWIWRHHRKIGIGDIWFIIVIDFFVVDICVWYFLRCKRGKGSGSADWLRTERAYKYNHSTLLLLYRRSNNEKWLRKI